MPAGGQRWRSPDGPATHPGGHCRRHRRGRACWNAIAKQVTDRLMAFAWIGIAAMAVGGSVLAVTGLPARRAIPYVIASAIIHIGYELGLMSSYRLGSFNQTYPIARGTSPLVVAVGAYFLANEHLGPAALIGIGTLAVGLMSLALSAGRLSRADLPAVGAAVLTGLTIAAYTVTDWHRRAARAG